MKVFKKSIAYLLILLLVSGYIPVTIMNTYAATAFQLTAIAYDSGTLTLRWPAMANTSLVKISYHIPSQMEIVEQESNQVTNTIKISNLQENFVYDIKVEVYNAGGTLLGAGFIYFCPRITFKAQILDQSRVAVAGGGFEIGVNPGLNLKWTMLKVWLDATNSFEYVNSTQALTQMQTKINSFYNESREFSTFNFRINISTDYSTLNSGSSQSSILINQNPDKYIANVSGNTTVTSDVNGVDANGEYNFDLLGRADKLSQLPTPQNIYQLTDPDIIPGSVYYMNIKPVVKNNEGIAMNAITVGASINQNGSYLDNAVNYTYTPIRFQISRDEANNVYVKVYRINQGSLDLPSLKYEIQTGDDPSIEGDWKVRKTLNDSFFPNNAAYALTAFTVSNINNLLYYKVVVKTDSSSDRLESPKMPYTLVEDNSRPPVPTGIVISKRTAAPGEVIDPLTNSPMLIKSTNITISWNKPTNWNEVKNPVPYDESKDVYFHIMVSTNQEDLTALPYPKLIADGKLYGEFQVKYRLLKYISANSPNIVENGDRLEYTINGLDLFKGEDSDGVSDNVIANPDAYPSFLLPNKVYFMQMYTANGANKGSTNIEVISDKSVPVSFTTLTSVGKEVPLPINLRLNKNGAEMIPGDQITYSNYIEVQFDKVNINWYDYTKDLSVTKAVYYDLYMSNSTSSDSYIVAASTEFLNGNVAFVGTDPQSTSIKATIKYFKEGTPAYNIFGNKLSPNTTYYFTLKTRLVFGSSIQESKFTSILPVTTTIGSILPPDETARTPLAPTDFAIAKDSTGDQLLSGSSVAFEWSMKEQDTRYELICTTKIVEPNAQPSTYEEDQYYVSFNTNMGDVLLDPKALKLAEGLEYDPQTKKCKYTLNKWISPNRLYYFSIRAQSKTTDKTSAWVSIPVTTLLIETPLNLEAVTDSEIELFWDDSNVNTKADDYKIYLKGPDDKDYKALSLSNYVISKDKSTFYARIFNLKYNSIYSVKVYKGATGSSESSVTIEKTGIKTLDKSHSLEVKWKGRTGYKYQVAIKSNDDIEYTVLADSDMEQYTNKDMEILPYYQEKSPELNGTDYYNFYARVNTIATVGQDGTVRHVALKSNMKYFVKVRSFKVDSLDTTIVSYSKFIGPVENRTEFNQTDYNDNDDEVQKKAILLDKISKIEDRLYWHMAFNTSVNKLLYKGKRVLNAMENTEDTSFVLDLESLGANIDTDILYIPVDIISYLNTTDKSLMLKTTGAEFSLRPGTLDLETLKSTNNINPSDIRFFKFTITRASNGISVPNQSLLASKIIKLEIKALNTTKGDEELQSLIIDKLYNKTTGLIQDKMNLIMAPDSANRSLSKIELEKYINVQTLDIEKSLAVFLEKFVEGSGSQAGIVKSSFGVTVFNDPMPVKLSYKDINKKITPYVYLDGENVWKKLGNSTNADKMSKFTVPNTGRYSLIATQSSAIDVPTGYEAEEELRKLMSSFDLSKVFGTGSSFYPENPVTVKEAVLLYETISGKGSEWAGLDLKQKILKLGLYDVFGSRNVLENVKKEDMAVIYAKLYSGKMGITVDSFWPTRKTAIKDESDISGKFYKSVILCIDTNILLLDSSGNFKPEASVSRAEAVKTLVKILSL